MCGVKNAKKKKRKKERKKIEKEGIWNKGL